MPGVDHLPRGLGRGLDGLPRGPRVPGRAHDAGSFRGRREGRPTTAEKRKDAGVEIQQPPGFLLQDSILCFLKTKPL